MLSRRELWELIEPVVTEAGLRLFDIDLPSSRGGVLRVTIAGTEDISNGVGVDDCATVSRKISALDRFEDVIPPKIRLEVSSPGVNRRLRLAEHFAEAVGEHIKVKYFDSEQSKKRTVTGTLKQFEEETLELALDDSDEGLRIPFADVSEAHVDFIFD